MRCNSLSHPSRRLERATNENIRLPVLAFPQTQHGSKSFPILVLFIFVPLPLFELGFILRLPSRFVKRLLSKAALSQHLSTSWQHRNREQYPRQGKCSKVAKSTTTTADNVLFLRMPFVPLSSHSTCSEKLNVSLRRSQSCDTVH